jgi:hypothetical protein
MISQTRKKLINPIQFFDAEPDYRPLTQTQSVPTFDKPFKMKIQ